jgi:hypothetical protein
VVCLSRAENPVQERCARSDRSGVWQSERTPREELLKILRPIFVSEKIDAESGDVPHSIEYLCG